MKKLCLLVSMLLLCSCEAQVNPATALTVTGIIGGAKEVSDALNNLGPDLGASGTAVVQGLEQQLSALLDQFQKGTLNPLNARLDSLNTQMQNIGIRLAVMTDHLKQIIQMERQCAFQDINVLIASLRTTADQFKSGVLFVRQPNPHLDEFAFDGHTFSTVPLNGGRVTLTGYNLWTTQTPDVDLVDDTSHKLITHLTPSRAGSDNEVSVSINGGDLQAHQGECLAFHVVAKAKHSFGTTPHEMYLPMCVPGQEKAEFMLGSKVSYACPHIEPHQLPMQSFYFQNTSGSDANVGPDIRTVNFDPHCKIVSTDVRQGDMYRQVKSYSVTHDDDHITVSGLLEGAVYIFWTLKTQSILHLQVTPTVSCTTDEVLSTLVQGQPLGLTLPDTNFSVDVPKSCGPGVSADQARVLEYDFRLMRSGTPPTEIFHSQRVACTDAGCPPSEGAVRNAVFESSVNTGKAGLPVQVTAKMTRYACSY